MFILLKFQIISIIIINYYKQKSTTFVDRKTNRMGNYRTRHQPKL